METISEKISVSGPWVSDKEVNYIADAARNGWNQHCFDYLDRFEKTARDYLGVNYALGTSSCTGALHLALLALGIGEGDEVILPETTWIATANALEYVRATPVFVDIDSYSWTIDTQKMQKAITTKTKAIIVVHLYGQPCNMAEILKIAKENHLFVIEDAAEALGGEICGQKAGSLGDIGCFSFHGSKAIVMGEGGLLVTNQLDLYEKAKFYSDQAKDPHKRFFNLETGYKYRLSNLQAAFGTAQLERADEIIAKKRQIFQWYQERLRDLPDIQLNVEAFQGKNTYWMPTILLGESYPLDGYQLSAQLQERNIDTRPFFYPLTMMPMYEGQRRDDTQIAYQYATRGINLPTGCTLTEEEVDYVCAHLRNILQPQQMQHYNLKGWLKYRELFKQKAIIISQNEDYKDYHIIDADFKQKAILLNITISQTTKEKMIAFGEYMDLEKIYIKCRQLDEKITLEQMGFTIVKITSLTLHQGNILDSIKNPFMEAEGYEWLFKLHINKN